MKLLLCILTLMCTSAYGITLKCYSNKNDVKTGLGMDIFPWYTGYLDPWLRWSNVPAPQPVILPKVQLNAHEHKPAVSDPSFQQRLDALAERIAAMEAQIKSLK